MKKIVNRFIAFILFAGPFVACDDDSDPTATEVNFATSELTVSESDGLVTLGIALNAPAAEDIVVDFNYSGSATNGVDYTAPEGSITILKGENTGTLPLNLIIDCLKEDAETIEISISSSLSSSSTYVVTIEANSAFVQSNFVGVYDADEPGYMHYDVEFHADETDENAIIADNWWDSGFALKYVFDPNSNSVTIPTQEFTAGSTTYVVSAGAQPGTYDPCTYGFVVPYVVKRKSNGAIVDVNTHTYVKK